MDDQIASVVTDSTTTVVVTSVNDPPVLAAASGSTAEDTAVTLTLGATDVDSAALTFSISSQPAHGSVTLLGSATCASFGQCSQQVSYTPASNYAGLDTFDVRASDGALQSTAQTVGITVTAVNDAPVNTVPGPQATLGGTSLVFSAANGISISVADVDAGSSPLVVTLGVTSGTGILTLGRTTNLSVSGNGSVTVTATGTLADLNAALQGLTFNPAPALRAAPP